MIFRSPLTQSGDGLIPGALPETLREFLGQTRRGEMIGRRERMIKKKTTTTG